MFVERVAREVGRDDALDAACFNTGVDDRGLESGSGWVECFDYDIVLFEEVDELGVVGVVDDGRFDT